MRKALLRYLLRWFRDTYYPLDGKKAELGSVGYSLDETIKLVDITFGTVICRRHYFGSKPFKNCPDCGWSSGVFKPDSK